MALLMRTISLTILTGTPTAPTAALTTNNTQLATTAFVKGKVEQSILTASKLYVQDNEPSFNAFDGDLDRN